MPHYMTAQEFKDRYLGIDIRTLEDLKSWVTRKVISLSPDFDSVVDQAIEKIHPNQGSYTQPFLFSRYRLGDFSGLSRSVIKERFFKEDGVTPLDDSDVDFVASQLNVTLP